LPPERSLGVDVTLHAFDAQAEPQFPGRASVAPRQLAQELLLREQVARVAHVRVIAHDASEIADEARLVLPRKSALVRLLVRHAVRKAGRRLEPVVVGLSRPGEIEAREVEVVEENTGEERFGPAAREAEPRFEPEPLLYLRVRRIEGDVEAG